MFSKVVIDTDLPLHIINKGKVRDIYDLEENLLLVVTDRISAFDYVLPNPIPSKGVCLTQLSRFWFEYTKDIVPNHMISTELADFPEQLQDFKDQLEYRSMLVKKTKVIPIECIVRGYISGSAWKSYKKDGTVCGIKMPRDLQESEQFPEPLFTPSTKADTGHDINISFEKMVELVGNTVSEKLKDYSLKLYSTAAEYARKRGIIIADTKFEFGIIDDEIIIIDEPMVGLDPKGIIQIKRIFTDLAREGVTIFMSTHTLSIAQEICSKIGIINNGKLIAVGTADDLRKMTNSEESLEEVFMILTEETSSTELAINRSD